MHRVVSGINATPLVKSGNMQTPADSIPAVGEMAFLSWKLGCITSEDKVSCFGLFVAEEPS